MGTDFHHSNLSNPHNNEISSNFEDLTFEVSPATNARALEKIKALLEQPELLKSSISDIPVLILECLAPYVNFILTDHSLNQDARDLKHPSTRGYFRYTQTMRLIRTLCSNLDEDQLVVLEKSGHKGFRGLVFSICETKRAPELRRFEIETQLNIVAGDLANNSEKSIRTVARNLLWDLNPKFFQSEFSLLLETGSKVEFLNVFNLAINAQSPEGWSKTEVRRMPALAGMCAQKLWKLAKNSDSQFTIRFLENSEVHLGLAENGDPNTFANPNLRNQAFAYSLWIVCYNSPQHASKLLIDLLSMPSLMQTSIIEIFSQYLSTSPEVSRHCIVGRHDPDADRLALPHIVFPPIKESAPPKAIAPKSKDLKEDVLDLSMENMHIDTKETFFWELEDDKQELRPKHRDNFLEPRLIMHYLHGVKEAVFDKNVPYRESALELLLAGEVFLNLYKFAITPAQRQFEMIFDFSLIPEELYPTHYLPPRALVLLDKFELESFSAASQQVAKMLSEELLANLAPNEVITDLSSLDFGPLAPLVLRFILANRHSYLYCEPTHEASQLLVFEIITSYYQPIPCIDARLDYWFDAHNYAKNATAIREYLHNYCMESGLPSSEVLRLFDEDLNSSLSRTGAKLHAHLLRWIGEINAMKVVGQLEPLWGFASSGWDRNIFVGESRTSDEILLRHELFSLLAPSHLKIEARWLSSQYESRPTLLEEVREQMRACPEPNLISLCIVLSLEFSTENEPIDEAVQFLKSKANISGVSVAKILSHFRDELRGQGLRVAQDFYKNLASLKLSKQSFDTFLAQFKRAIQVSSEIETLLGNFDPYKTKPDAATTLKLFKEFRGIISDLDAPNLFELYKLLRTNNAITNPRAHGRTAILSQYRTDAIKNFFFGEGYRDWVMPPLQLPDTTPLYNLGAQQILAKRAKRDIEVLAFRLKQDADLSRQVRPTRLSKEKVEFDRVTMLVPRSPERSIRNVLASNKTVSGEVAAWKYYISTVAEDPFASVCLEQLEILDTYSSKLTEKLKVPVEQDSADPAPDGQLTPRRQKYYLSRIAELVEFLSSENFNSVDPSWMKECMAKLLISHLFIDPSTSSATYELATISDSEFWLQCLLETLQVTLHRELLPKLLGSDPSAIQRVANLILIPEFESLLETIHSSVVTQAESDTSPGKSVSITILPTRGPFLEASGYLSSTCWRSEEDLAKRFPNILFLAFGCEKEKGSFTMEGGSLLVKATTTSGERALVIRGFNPHMNLFRLVKAENLFPKFLSYVESEARRLGYRYVLLPRVPYCGGPHTNRPQMHAYFKQTYFDTNSEILPLVKDKNLEFNNFDVSEKCIVLIDTLQ